jgi:hypothetical protein
VLFDIAQSQLIEVLFHLTNLITETNKHIRYSDIFGVGGMAMPSGRQVLLSCLFCLGPADGKSLVQAPLLNVHVLPALPQILPHRPLHIGALDSGQEYSLLLCGVMICVCGRECTHLLCEEAVGSARPHHTGPLWLLHIQLLCRRVLLLSAPLFLGGGRGACVCVPTFLITPCSSARGSAIQPVASRRVDPGRGT